MYKSPGLEWSFGNDPHRIGNPGEGAQAPRRRVLLLPHGRPDDGGGNRHHGRRHPRDRRAARTGRGDDGPRVGPHSESPGGLHGGIRTRHHQPHHRGRPCLGRLRARGRARWIRPARSVRAWGISGDRPARDDEARHEVGRAGTRPTPDPGARRSRVRMRPVGQARTGVPRPSGRRALRSGRGGRRPLEGIAERQETATARVSRRKRSRTSFADSRRRSDPSSYREAAFSGRRRKRPSRPSSSVSESPSSRRPRAGG